MSQLKLRAYQQRIIESARISLSKYKKIIIYAPGGSGKSVIIAFMSVNSALKNNKTLVLTHRQEILKQNYDKMNLLGIDVKIVNSRTQAIPSGSVFCAMSQTVVSRCKKKFEWAQWVKSMNFIIIDEVHRQDAEPLYDIFNEKSWIVGLTATVLRSGTMRQLGYNFNDIVNVIGAQEIINLGYLTPSKNFSFQAPKLEDVPVDRNTGDYVQKSLQKIFQKPERYAGIISNYKRICPDTKAIVFTTGAVHCIDLCREFNLAGISAKYLISNYEYSSDEQYSGPREKLLKDFDDGKFKVLVNIYVLDTGFDCSSIETVILDFSTKSYSRYIQAISRGSRPYPNKPFFYVLDFGANIQSFGKYEGEPILSLWHNPGGNGVPLTKECPVDKKDLNGNIGCGRLVPISAKDCPFPDCKYHFATEKDRYEVELQEIIDEQTENSMSIAKYVAKKMLEGKNINYILMNVCIKNAGRQKQAFLEAIKYMRTKNGDEISPKYWYFFKKNILKDKLV